MPSIRQAADDARNHRTVTVTTEDARIIASALRVDAARLRRNAPQPWYVGSAQSRAYCEAMGEAVKRDKLAATFEDER